MRFKALAFHNRYGRHGNVRDKPQIKTTGMKTILTAVILSVAILTAGAQTITVKSDQARDIDFSKYKSFSWASQVDNELDKGVYFLNDLVLKAQVREAVKSELVGLGYEMNKENPDLVVNFRVFDKPVKIEGMEGYGDRYWDDQDMRDISDKPSYELEAGSIILSLADRESGRIVWHGFASGLIDNNEFIKDEGKVREAVNLIFEEFNKRAKEYTRK
jgi:hypothetical protein